MTECNSNTPLKCCYKCSVEYPLSREFFYVDRANLSGFSGLCKACEKKKQDEWKAKNPEKVKATKARYVASNPEKVKAAKKKWEDEHPEYKHEHYEKHKEEYNRMAGMRYIEQRSERLLRATQYYCTNREIILVRVRKYRYSQQEPPTQNKIDVQQRRARKRGLMANYTLEDWLHALDFFDGKCAICNKPIGLWHTLALDHWIPLSNPDCTGTVPTNIVPLCHGVDGCNNRKSNKNAGDWIVSQYGKRKASVIVNRVQEFFKTVRVIS